MAVEFEQIYAYEDYMAGGRGWSEKPGASDAKFIRNDIHDAQIKTLKAENKRLKKALDQVIDRGSIEFAYIAGTRRKVLSIEGMCYWAPSRTPELAEYLKEQKK